MYSLFCVSLSYKDVKVKIGTSWKWMMRFTLRSLYLGERKLCYHFGRRLDMFHSRLEEMAIDIELLFLPAVERRSTVLSYSLDLAWVINKYGCCRQLAVRNTIALCRYKTDPYCFVVLSRRCICLCPVDSLHFIIILPVCCYRVSTIGTPCKLSNNLLNASRSLQRRERNMAAGSVALSTPQACVASDAVSNLHRQSAYPASIRPLCAMEIRLQVTVPIIAVEWVSLRSRFKRRKLCVCVF